MRRALWSACLFAMICVAAPPALAHDKRFDQFDTYIGTTALSKVLAFCNIDAGHRDFCARGLGDYVVTENIEGPLNHDIHGTAVCWPRDSAGRPDAARMGRQVLARLEQYTGDRSTWVVTILAYQLIPAMYPCLR
ncbi:MAG: hypothetical protein ACP5NI_11245 [Acetobacteraceae bacterium]